MNKYMVIKVIWWDLKVNLKMNLDKYKILISMRIKIIRGITNIKEENHDFQMED